MDAMDDTPEHKRWKKRQSGNLDGYTQSPEVQKSNTVNPSPKTPSVSVFKEKKERKKNTVRATHNDLCKTISIIQHHVRERAC